MIFLHLILSLASSSDTSTICMSSFTISINLVCNLPFSFLLPQWHYQSHTLLYSHHTTFPSLSLPLNVPTPTPLPLFSLNNSIRNLILNDPHVWFGKDLTPNVQYREYTGSMVYFMAVLIMINGCGNGSDFCQFNYNLICMISDIWVYRNSIRMFFDIGQTRQIHLV